MSWKKPVLITAWSLAALAWLIQIPVFVFVAEKKTLLLSLGGAALVTELAVYATAGLLGLTLMQSRARIWNTIKAVAMQQEPGASSSK